MDAGHLVAKKYRLQRALGAGSMGSVWAARNELTNRDFAIKFLRTDLAQNSEALNRFFHEARACGQIRHPAIVDVFDVGQAEDGPPFLVMELLEGEGLDARIARQGRMRPVGVCKWISIVARGLEEAHVRGLIHRDLKPGNIFFAIDKAGDVFPKVLDFGISKEISGENFEVQTNQGMVLGSPAYMSPEQARGDLEIDARADVWSLGVIMYEGLTGQLPFHANNYNALMLAIITRAHTPVQELAPEVPPALALLVDDALCKDRNRRVKSAAHLADRLERIHSTLTQTPFTQPDRSDTMASLQAVSTQNTWARVREVVSSRRGTTSLAVASFLVLLAFGSYLGWRAAGPPAVQVASRFAPALSRLILRTSAEFGRRLAEPSGSEEPSEGPVEADVTLDLDIATASPTPRTPRGPTTTAPKAAVTADPNDPHGGVENSGF